MIDYPLKLIRLKHSPSNSTLLEPLEWTIFYMSTTWNPTRNTGFHYSLSGSNPCNQCFHYLNSKLTHCFEAAIPLSTLWFAFFIRTICLTALDSFLTLLSLSVKIARLHFHKQYDSTCHSINVYYQLLLLVQTNKQNAAKLGIAISLPLRACNL